MADPEDREPASESGEPASESGEHAADPPVTHAVTLTWRGGREETVAVPEDGTVLDTAEDAGIGLPHGCRTGACATCTARLVSGEVEHRRPARALKDRHRKRGYVLACIATPRTDCRLEVGSDVAGDLVENPWK